MEEKKENTKTIGERTQGIVLASLLKNGKIVLLPFGDNQRYDLAVDDNGTFSRIQCKTARVINNGDAIAFETASSYAHRGGNKKHYRGEADYFGVYSPYTGKVYLIPVSEVGLTQCVLRLNPTGNKQTIGVRWAKDFEI